MKLRRALLVIWLVCLCGRAFASFPGENGKLVFQYGGCCPTIGIATMNSNGTDLTVVHHTGSGFVPRWSPDGSRITFQGPGNQIYVMNADGSNLKQVTFSDPNNTMPTFSPNGLEIYFIKIGDLYKTSADGTGGETLVLPLFSLTSPSLTPPCAAGSPIGLQGLGPGGPDISPDGLKVTYDLWCGGDPSSGFNPRAGLGGYTNVYVINLDGTNLIQITHNDQVDHTAQGDTALTDIGCQTSRWSPDGTKLLFACWELSTSDRFALPVVSEGHWSLQQANADGSNLTMLLGPSTDGFYTNSSWAPDGTKITSGNAPENYRYGLWHTSDAAASIFVMNSNGTNLNSISNHSISNLFPDWQPVGPSYTQQGSDVSVSPLNITNNTVPLSLTFSSIIQAGTTSLTSSNQGPTTPSGFQIGDPAIYYDVSTSALYSGSVTLCFSWSEGQFFDESTVKLFHYENNIWVDVTTSLDGANNKVCGQASSLSPFALFENVHYNFAGFYPPVDNYPTRNTVKAGSAIPVKFSLGADQGLNIFADSYPASQTMNCDGNTPIDAVEQTVTAESSSLSFNEASGQYVYIWKTDKAWSNTCRRLMLNFKDGSSQIADFAFTK